MGIACAQDFFQSIMMKLLGDIKNILVYIDNILTIQKVDKSKADHMKKIKQILERLNAKGFCANLCKLFLMQKEVELLGYPLTTGGLKPQPAKIKAMHHIIRPKNYKQLKMLLGVANSYQDIYPKRWHFPGTTQQVGVKEN